MYKKGKEVEWMLGVQIHIESQMLSTDAVLP